jgi:hypothetical protein
LYLSLISFNLFSIYFFANFLYSDGSSLETLRNWFWCFLTGLDGSPNSSSVSPNVDGGLGPLCFDDGEGLLFETTDTFEVGTLPFDDWGLLGTAALPGPHGFFAL